MKPSGLWKEIKANPLILVAVIVFHLVLIIMLSMNLTSSEVPEMSSEHKKTVKAVVIDASKIDETKKRKQAEAKKKSDAEKKRLADEKKKKEAEQKRLAELKKKKEAEKKRQAEQNKKQETEKKRLAEIKKKKAAEKKKAEEARKKAEAEKKRLAEEKKRKEAEAKRKAELEKKRLAELEEKRRQDEAAELRRKLEEEERMEAEARRQEERNRVLASLRAQYVKLIEQKVERNWLRPVTSTSEMTCEVIVTQTSLGDVTSVRLQKCASDLAFQQSIERAVRKASPLPPPPNPEVFDREIHFTFKPGA